MSDPASLDIQPREYRLAPELRRCCWYALFGVVAIMGMIIWARSYIIIPVIIIIYFMRWKIRVDREGIWQRTLFGWRKWAWSDFASGLMIKHPMRQAIFAPRRFLLRRKLDLSFLGKDDCREVISLINRFYKLPDAPVLPGQIKIKYAFRCSAIFDDRYIRINAKGKRYEYMWSEIERIHVFGLDPLRRDFRRMEIVFKDTNIALYLIYAYGQVANSWSGASIEEVYCFVDKYAPASIMDVFIIGDPIEKREDIEECLASLRKQSRALKIAYISMVLLCIVMFMMCIYNGRLVIAGPGVLFMAIIYSSLFVYRYIDIRKKCVQLTEKLNSLSSGSK